MSIIAGRIDNRLLHGIVATQWYAEIKPQRIMVIDDEYANDPTKKAGMRMSKPAGSALSIITHKTAYDHFKAGKYDNHTVMVIARSPQTFLELKKIGQIIPILTVGGTVTPAEGIPAVQVGRRTFVLNSEIPIYREIAKNGTRIEVRYVPSDKSEPLSNYVKLD
jgi:mannose/fructose/N-acetylgalactosamine-specific phosphotransferase system component IIB